jgi:S1-C subfamily serine protease
MSQRGWSASIVGWVGIVVLLIALAYLFRDSFYKTAGGPVAVVVGGSPKHGFIGIDFGEATAAPLTIEHVISGSGAEKAGLKPGDVVVAAGAARNPDLAALGVVVKGTKPGDELVMTIRRGTEDIQMRVTLISFAEQVNLNERERSNKKAP